MSIREFVGWLIAVIGLLLVGVVLVLALNRFVFEAMALSLPSVIVFRAGIGLVRMASAARIARRLTQSEQASR